MNTLLIFGAGHGLGTELVAQAIQHRRIVALVRNPQQAKTLQRRGVTVIAGDALSQEQVLQACQSAGPDAQIVSTLGGTRSDYSANRLIIDTAESAGIRQMLLVTSIGCGDSWPTLSGKARVAFGRAVREKSLAESWLQTSALQWCIVRPGGLTDGIATGHAQRVQSEIHGRVRRSDVALHIHQLLATESSWGQIYAVCDPTLHSQAASIARYELGLHHTGFERTKDDFFSGLNTASDLTIRNQECVGESDDYTGVRCNGARCVRFMPLAARHHGKIDVELAKEMIAAPLRPPR